MIRPYSAMYIIIPKVFCWIYTHFTPLLERERERLFFPVNKGGNSFVLSRDRCNNVAFYHPPRSRIHFNYLFFNSTTSALGTSYDPIHSTGRWGKWRYPGRWEGRRLPGNSAAPCAGCRCCSWWDFSSSVDRGHPSQSHALSNRCTINGLVLLIFFSILFFGITLLLGIIITQHLKLY